MNKRTENALIHGIDPSGKKGLIVIKGFKQGDRLYFSITDNGIGIAQEQVNLLLKAPLDSSAEFGK